MKSCLCAGTARRKFTRSIREAASSMLRVLALATLLTGSLVTSATAQLVGDPKRGGEVYRNCAACHSLQPDLHLSGPSLAGAVGRKAGTAPEFHRYSPGLKSADFV
jgi:cytochrome c